MEVLIMGPETLELLITIVLIIVIIVFLSKRFIKLAIAVGAILLIFNIGFMMNGTELRNFLHLDKYVSKEDADTIENTINDLDNKREEYGVVDSDAVYDSMTGAIQNGTTILIEGLGHIDIVKFSQNVSHQIVEAGSESIDYDALEIEIKEQLKGISDSDLDRIMDMIKTNVEEIE
jgi:energy-coupling factor transporter transmembrane protein EcfT